MPQIMLSNADYKRLQNIIACIEYELEDAPVKPKGWSYTDYRAAFFTTSRKFGKTVKSGAVSLSLSESEQTLLRCLINVYVAHYSDLYDDPIGPEEAEALREVYSTLS